MIRVRRRVPVLDESRYVPGFVAPDRSTEAYHLDGVPWHEAELPPKRHRCWPQTWAYTSYFTYVERCACGAIRMNRRDGPWLDKNQSLKSGYRPSET